MMLRRSVIRLTILSVLLLAALLPPRAALADPVTTLNISYAYYDPLSLILRDRGILQAAVGPNVKINWVLSQGSNKALEFLRGGSIDFGQTAGSAALLGRANGAPVQAIGVTTNAEWTAIVVPAGSPIKSLADLKGKRVAATPGTDPYIFLLRSLASVGLSGKDITLVPLQHPLGRQALAAGQVDAWAGLDPFMAEAQLQDHDVLIYRNPHFISTGTLLVREDFEQAHPETVRAVLTAYNQARNWAIANPAGIAAILAKDTGLPLNVVQLQLSRCHFRGEAITPAEAAAILGAGPVLQASGKLSAGANLPQAGATLVNSSFTTALGFN
jgi:sulfonate transport system substrate-binding protein